MRSEGEKTVTDKQRLDAFLVDNGWASGREKAKELIRDGAVTVNGKVIDKASFGIGEGDDVVCEKEACAYVGRGGLKLEKALSLMDLSLDGAVAMDIGASTGGFTHCLLKNGVSKVYAVDVGHGQLHPTLCADSRVENLEGTDVRSAELAKTVSSASVDLISIDVSFISLHQVLPYALPFLKENGTVIVLIKPQFEVGKADVGKGGIVRNKAAHVRVLRELTAFFVENNFTVSHLTVSPILGGAGRNRGNIEYLAILKKDRSPSFVGDVRQLAEEAFAQF